MFITREELERVKIGTVDEGLELLNTVLVRVHNAAVEEAMRCLPALISSLVRQSQVMDKMAAQFYEDNKDLSEHKQLVYEVTQTLDAANPGLSYDDLMAKVATEVRLRLQTLKPSKPVNLNSLDDSCGVL